MKKIIALAILSSSYLLGFSQITATTSSGKKVILNMDGTWKYADNTIVNQKPCAENKTGNLTIKNNTDNDIYFYYSSSEYSTSNSFIKIKSKSSKAINNLPVVDKNWNAEAKISYAWKATLELQGTSRTIHSMEGVESGQFILLECDVLDLEVGN